MTPQTPNSRTRFFQALFFIAPFCVALAAFGQEASEAPGALQGFTFTFGEMFTFFFLMLGPVKLIGPFAQITRKADSVLTRKIAVRAFAFSSISLLLAVILGENSLRKYNIRVPVLAIAAGIILFLVALRTVMEQFDPDAHNEPPRQYEPNLQHAFFPLAFPTIVTPYGLAAVIVCMSLTPEYLDRAEIGAVLAALMVVNLLAMLFAKPLLRYLQMPLMLFGVVLGVIQVALGLSIIFRGLQALGFGTGKG
jgi:multiple antibiotic resistance protein